MSTTMKRVMVSITPDLEQGLDAIKRGQFYNRPYAEVYRYIFALGLNAASAHTEDAKETECQEKTS